MRYHCIAITITKLNPKAAVMPNTGKHVEQKQLLFIADGNAKWHRPFERQFSSSLQN